MWERMKRIGVIEDNGINLNAILYVAVFNGFIILRINSHSLHCGLQISRRFQRLVYYNIIDNEIITNRNI